MEWLEALDRELFLYLNGLHTEWLDVIMWRLSQVAYSVPWFVFIFWRLNRAYGWRKALAIVGGTGLVILLCDRISVELFKEQFERYRPSRNLELEGLVHLVRDSNGNFYTGGWYGFVSSHATNFFGMAMYFFLWLKKDFRWVALVLLLWACIVSYSRIYLGVHYPGDIVGGALLGVLLGWIAYRAIGWVLRKLERAQEGAFQIERQH